MNRNNYDFLNRDNIPNINNRNLINRIETKVKDRLELFTDTSRTILWIIITLNILFFFYSFSYLIKPTNTKTLFGIIVMFLLAVYSLIIFTYAAKALGFINKIPWDSILRV